MKLQPVLRALSALACAAALVASAPARADSVSLRYAGNHTTLETELLIPVQATPITIHMGTYDIERQSPAGSFEAYCSDPFQYSSGAFSAYDSRPLATHLAAQPSRLADVALLFGHAYAGSLASPDKAAGFQLAMWEMWHDDKNLATGLVQTTVNTSASVVAEANWLLGQLGSWSGAGTAYQVTVYASDAYQDYVTAVPVPEPGAWAMLMAGFALAGGMAVRGRRMQ